MSDLINGREMLKRYQEDLCYDIACKDCSMSTEDGGCRVEEWIDKFPSADRPQGEWIEMGQNEDGTHNVKCNQCDSAYKMRGHAKSISTKLKYRFCPHCGARMKGADDE